jgi:hypothetical protein
MGDPDSVLDPGFFMTKNGNYRAGKKNIIFDNKNCDLINPKPL